MKIYLYTLVSSRIFVCRFTRFLRDSLCQPPSETFRVSPFYSRLSLTSFSNDCLMAKKFIRHRLHTPCACIHLIGFAACGEIYIKLNKVYNNATINSILNSQRIDKATGKKKKNSSVKNVETFSTKQ